MYLRNFILFSNIDSFRFALGIVASEGSQANANESLLPLVAKGDGQAMKRCIDVYGPLVWSIVCRRISERIDAEETCQGIFTEIWQKAGTYNPAVARETTFIGLIARRRSIDWQRKQSRLPVLTDLESVPEASSVIPIAGTGLDRELLWKALEQLPEKTRELFSLHFVKGMTHEEIVKETGMPSCFLQPPRLRHAGTRS
ncbi:MAG: sigma-70 family RNA polymerase sigma factor [Verrucomicrobia bacterium]|nr:sigma-70 family RNA polymerase sigma factor [Verrucomicrobiota bacterium]MDA0725473.1 sigma-70 family RNA polymerase sigma factor [Verrucomicrobiota bacterium]MDA1048165.1 sigma-70 family RNA polymerase sigma factor [Verrucomicrobiota bacterium]